MDDLLIIILTLVVAVIGAFGRKKKKEANQSQPAGGSQQPQDFWDMLMNQGEQQPQPQFIYDDEPEETETEKVVVEEAEAPKYNFTSEEEGKSDIKEELIKSMNSERKKVKIEGEDFSLRKAVIYSEILNRKYT